jgi:cytochrome c-type biogenesis protein CcmH/NrfG
MREVRRQVRTADGRRRRQARRARLSPASRRPRLPSAPAVCACLLLLSLSCACNRGAPAAGNAQDGNAAASASPQASDGGGAQASADISQLDAEVERLEKRAERNPGDDEALADLAKAYVRRGDAERTTGRLREALLDYRRAQSADPDNPDAQRNAAEISPLVEGAPTGENGEPAPLPITPGVTDDEERPTPTPKKQ